MGVDAVITQQQACSAVFGLPMQTLRETVRKGLGREVAKRWAEWLLDILAVACRVKPAFLHDYSVATVEEVQSTLNRLAEASTTKHVDLTQLRCLELPPHGDVMVVHKTATREYLSTLLLECVSLPWFVDVSGKDPAITARGVKNTCSISSDSQKEGVPTGRWEGARVYFDWAMEMIGGEKAGSASTGLCPTTVAGLMLGYPVVYFLGPDHSNCLGSVPLCVTTVTASLRPTGTNLQHNHILSKFSIPMQFSADDWTVDSQIWVEMMCERAGKECLWDSVQIMQEEVMLNHVAL